MTSRASGRLSVRIMGVTAIGFAVLWACLFALISRSNDAIIERQATDLARTVHDHVAGLRAAYTAVTAKIAREQGASVQVVADYRARVGAIPLPATFVHEVNDAIHRVEVARREQARAGGQTDEPFTRTDLVSRWNINPSKGLADDVDRRGFDFLLGQQEALRARAGGSSGEYERLLASWDWRPYTELGQESGRPVLRYVGADLASQKTCVDCHNQLEQSPEIASRRGPEAGKRFAANELMGAVTVTVPLASVGRFASSSTRTVIAATTILALVVLAGVAVLLKRTTRAIESLTLAAARIVNEGDLGQRIDASTNDEVGELARCFGQLVQKLREIPRTLGATTGQLSDAVARLQRSADDQDKTVSQQAVALQETQVTAQEIKQTSMLAADKAEGVLQIAKRAEDVGRSGEASVEQSLAGLTEIRSHSELIAQKIAELSERTRQIGGITATVKDLADQSNMLALNAAIEAVRSGEHGRGFAVVAREIRSLADQSIQATNRVREILDDISSAIAEAVAISEKGKQRIEGGVVQVRHSGENLRELSGIVRETSAAVRQIAAAVSQQNAGIAQIFTAVSEQTRMMDQTVRGLEATKDALKTVESASAGVAAVVSAYKV